MSASTFSYSSAQLSEYVTDALTYARAAGATDAEAVFSEGVGHSVTVRLSEIETIEYQRDKSLSVSVYLGQARGQAQTADLTPAALRATVDAALNIARYTAADPYAGLPEEHLFATEFPDLSLYHPWPISVEDSLELARICEQAALDTDPRILNSEGAMMSTQASHFIYGNSRNFLQGFPTSRHSISCSVIGVEGTSMQRDYWFDSRRDWADLSSPEAIGRRCGDRTARRLGARPMRTMRVPVLFEAPIAQSLISHFAQAISGRALYREASFLTNSLGQPIFPTFIQLEEQPWLLKGQQSAAFDGEGVATTPRYLVESGILNGYFLSTYSARKLGMQSTGNAGGWHNLSLSNSGHRFQQLLAEMGRGLLVTELMGQGMNLVTGDYSRGAAGFWVEHGEIQYPVEEITIAGNLKDMLRGIRAIGTDVLPSSAILTGSILLDSMTVAGQ